MGQFASFVPKSDQVDPPTVTKKGRSKARPQPFANTIFASADIRVVTREDLRSFLQDLNTLYNASEMVVDQEEERLLFATKKGSDTTIFWKSTIQIVCVKFNSEEALMEIGRILTLGEFLKIYRNVRYDLITAVQIEEEKSRLISQMGELVADAKPDNYVINECCICFKNPKNTVLPCTHGFCEFCINTWKSKSGTCPLCRNDLTSVEDCWVLSEEPNSNEICQHIATSFMNIAKER